MERVVYGAIVRSTRYSAAKGVAPARRTRRGRSGLLVSSSIGWGRRCCTLFRRHGKLCHHLWFQTRDNGSFLDWLKYTGSTYQGRGLGRLRVFCACVSGHPRGFWRRGVKLALFGFVFGFGGWLCKALRTKRLGRFCAWRGGVNRAKLALFGFALFCASKYLFGRKFLFYILLCAFDFFGNWVRFFK